MITTMYKVKLYRGMFDGTSSDIPDENTDETEGYYVGFRLLCGANGIDYICTDATATLAVWKTDTKNDEEINDTLQSISSLVMRYCNTMFVGDYPAYYESSKVNYQSANNIIITGADFDDLFYPGDSMVILGAVRNQGFYSITSVNLDTLIVSNEFRVVMFDDNEQILLIVNWPQGISQIGARMAEYDVYRRNESPGLAQESVGNYSASKEATDILGTAYPDSVVAGIQSYKRPRIADGLGNSFNGFRFNA